MVIIWPLLAKLRPTLAAQQCPKSAGNLLAPSTPVNQPWNAASSRVRGQDRPPPFPSVIHELLPAPAYNFTISGVTKDSTGAVLGGCTVKLFATATDAILQTATSDAVTGAYAFPNVSRQLTCCVVAYKAGSPDTAGTTVNTLVGT